MLITKCHCNSCSGSWYFVISKWVGFGLYIFIDIVYLSLFHWILIYIVRQKWVLTLFILVYFTLFTVSAVLGSSIKWENGVFENINVKYYNVYNVKLQVNSIKIYIFKHCLSCLFSDGYIQESKELRDTGYCVFNYTIRSAVVIRFVHSG